MVLFAVKENVEPNAADPGQHGLDLKARNRVLTSSVSLKRTLGLGDAMEVFLQEKISRTGMQSVLLNMGSQRQKLGNDPNGREGVHHRCHGLRVALLTLTFLTEFPTLFCRGEG